MQNIDPGIITYLAQASHTHVQSQPDQTLYMLSSGIDDYDFDFLTFVGPSLLKKWSGNSKLGFPPISGD